MSPYHREVVLWLRGSGATDDHLEHGGRHLKLVFPWHGRVRHCGICVSPSSPRAVRKKIGDLKEMLGLVRRTRHVGAPRQRRSRKSGGGFSENRATLPLVDFGLDFRDRLLLHPVVRLLLGTTMMREATDD